MTQIKKVTMRRAILLLPILVAACATPREACISNARAELGRLTNQIRTTEENIQRGYAIARMRDESSALVPCTKSRRDGTTYNSFCQTTATTRREEPVAINVAEERHKLEGQYFRLQSLGPATDAAVQQCAANYPQ